MNIDDEVRRGLIRLGASEADLEHVFLAHSPEERKKRIEAVLDAQIGKRLANAGMNDAEIAGALRGGDVASEAVESMVARAMEDPRVQASLIEGFLEDPRARAELSRSLPPKRPSRLRGAALLLGAGLLAFGAFKAYRALTKGPCEVTFGDAARASAMFGQPVKMGFSTKNAYGCAVDLDVAEPGKYGTLARIEMGDGSRYEAWRREMESKKVYRFEPVQLGDGATLAIAPPAQAIDMDAELKKVREQAARVTAAELPRDGMVLQVDDGRGGSVTFDRDLTRTVNEAAGLKRLREKVLNAPPSEHRLLVRANDVALQVTVNGTEAQARALAKALSADGALDAMRSARFGR